LFPGPGTDSFFDLEKVLDFIAANRESKSCPVPTVYVCFFSMSFLT
jgi:hypothetical protein